MPSRLRSIKPVHQNSPKQRRNKTMSLSSFSGLASPRRAVIGRSSSGSGRTGRGLSRRAEKLLDDADDSDESYKSAHTPVIVRNTAGDHNRSSTEYVARKATASEAGDGDFAKKGGPGHPMGCGEVDCAKEPVTTTATKRSSTRDYDAFEAMYPDDESPPRVQPKTIEYVARPVPDAPGISPPKAEHKKPYANEHEDKRENRGVRDGGLALLGPEALRFVYGPDPDLSADVFEIPSNASPEELDRSFEEQMEQLDLASRCPPEFHREVGTVCGMKTRHLAFLHPRDFCEIKRDAVRYAYEKLKEDRLVSRNENSWKEIEKDLRRRDRHEGVWKAAFDVDEGVWKAAFDATHLERDEGTVETAVETDASDREGEGSPSAADFWSEENCSTDGGEEDCDFDVAEGCLFDIAYGSHGNYSYNCDEEVEDHEASDLDWKEMEDGSRLDGEDGSCENGGKYFEGLRDRDDGSSVSKLNYSYRTGDGYEDDEQVHEGNGYYSGQTKAGPSSSDNEKQYHRVKPENQYSPTGLIEFDQLIQDSVLDQDYFNQLLPRNRGSPSSSKDERGETFDPFGLHSGSNRSSVTSGSFVSGKDEGGVAAVSFVGPLPKREVEEDDGEDGPTMGDSINGERKSLSKMMPTTDVGAAACKIDSANNGVVDSLSWSESSMDDGEDLEIEIETFSNDTSVGKQDRIDDAASIQSRAVSCSSGDTLSLSSSKTTEAGDRRLSPPDKERGQENGQGICQCFDACVEDVGESIDISFHVGEKIFSAICRCEEPRKS